MSEPVNVSTTIGGADAKSIRYETGHLAQQANGAILASLEKTQVLVTATAANQTREGADFFPLTVDVEEKMYAAGKIPGSFFRREARAGENAILTCRLIDRAIRPSFPDDFRNEVHVVATILGADQKNPYDVVSINAASLALGISDIPFNGPIGAVRLAYTVDGDWISYPTYQTGEEATFELVVAGRVLQDVSDQDDVAIMMVEAASNAGAAEKQKDGAAKLQESVLADGLEIAKKHIKEAVEIQRQLMAVAGVKTPFEYEPQADYTQEVYDAVAEVGSSELSATFGNADKVERKTLTDTVKATVKEKLTERFGEDSELLAEISPAFKALTKTLVRQHIVANSTRVDGRKVDEIRPLSAMVGKIDVAHGSGLFERGDTQVLNIATLGTQRMDQLLDGIDPYERKRFMHHYNFPPFSTGEVGFMRGPKRREIGHGALVEKAISGVLPSMEEFPYTIRVVSEVLSSNGSTSMASLCASSLSLMDAGVPTKAAVAGIAMGLIYESGNYITLTDILGEEDAYGDMDFKVAGTEDTVTALQLDTKIDGIPSEVLVKALEQAKNARLKILETMNSALDAPREDVGETAPRIVAFEIPMDKVGEVIGPKGKVINALQEKTGAEITIDDSDGVAMVTLASTSRDAIEAAEAEIQNILNPPEAEIGESYDGEVVNITNFGAFVNILPGTDGLLHISKLGGGKRLEKVEEVLNLGDAITVVVDEIEKSGRGSPRISLSLPTGGNSKSRGDASSKDVSGDDEFDDSEESSEESDSNSLEEGNSSRQSDSSRNNDSSRRNDSSRNNDSRNSRNRGSRSSRRSRSDKQSGDVEEVSFSDSFAQDMGSNDGASDSSKSRGRHRDS